MKLVTLFYWMIFSSCFLAGPCLLLPRMTDWVLSRVPAKWMLGSFRLRILHHCLPFRMMMIFPCWPLPPLPSPLSPIPWVPQVSFTARMLVLQVSMSKVTRAMRAILLLLNTESLPGTSSR